MPNRLTVAIGYSQIVGFALWLALSPSAILAQQLPTLPPCGDARPTSALEPWSGDGSLWCLENVQRDATLGAIGQTQIAAAPNGDLFAVLPEQGQLVQLTDTNADLLADARTVLAENLIYPTGITYHEGALYLTTQQHLYRYDLATQTLSLIADDLASGWTGYPSGSPFVHEGAVYVGTGADATCSEGRGNVYRYTPNTDTPRELVATGLHAPASITAYNGRLWVADTHTDMLWELVEGVDYGACSGQPVPADVLRYAFPSGSAPMALAPYNAQTFPYLEGHLLVALRGNLNEVIIEGYAVVALSLLPDQTWTPHKQVLPFNPPINNTTTQKMHIQASGFYPHHVYGVAVDGHGWVYVSAGKGTLVALRHR